MIINNFKNKKWIINHTFNLFFLFYGSKWWHSECLLFKKVERKVGRNDDKLCDGKIKRKEKIKINECEIEEEVDV